MSFEITRGIAAYDCPDHYAILGVPVNASAGEIRKRYLKIARSLHPDSRGPGTDASQASTLLSKLVNPAYETLSQDKQREEYRLLIKLVGQRVAATIQQFEFAPGSEAQALLTANAPEDFYLKNVEALAKEQYQKLEQVKSITEKLSDLNLAYLLRQEEVPKQRFVTSQAVQSSLSPSVPVSQPTPTAAPTTPPAANAVGPSTAPTGNKPAAENFVSQYVRRAEELIAKNRYTQAVQELREGLKLSPQNSQCQKLLGRIYLEQKQLTMAKVHFQQALKLNPSDSEARKGLEKIAKLTKTASPAANANPPSGRKGVFGLFGGKKK